MSPSTSAPSSAHPARTQPLSSPMPADALEYFSETAAKMGGSAASGMVIQSPDGRPAGIFFQPKASHSTPPTSGSKPSLSRGVSAPSIRRAQPSPSEHSDTSELPPRDRRLANSSSGSSSPASAETSDSRPPQLRVPNAGAYQNGSMFAPQVGIHSVLNSSRPPMTTPLGPTMSSQPQEPSAGAEAASAPADDTDKQSNNKIESTAIAGSESEADKTNQGAVGSDSASVGENSTGGAGPAATGSRARQPVASGSNSATASPNARNSTNVANRVRARQSFGAVTASPSDAKTKPSAVPQSGFMMGMGFTASARRGRGPKKAPVREAVLPPIKVLIVEDNPINQRILSMFMGKKKIKYDVANNGREAVEKWKTGGYHLILMDIQLPVMDGIEATKEIRKLERNDNIGILPSTPPASADSRVENQSSGGSKTLNAKGLMKNAVAGSSGASQSGDQSSPSQQRQQRPASGASGSGGPNAQASSSSLVNGAGDANRIPTTTRPGAGSNNPFRASVIIVALTASVLSSDRVEALAAGCNDFLNKPVSLPWLNQKILEWGSMMYLIYSGLSSDGIPPSTATAGASGNRVDRTQMHLGFGYGPAEKAKALANNLHLGDTLALKKKKKVEEKGRMEKNQSSREENERRKAEQQRKRQEEEASKATSADEKNDDGDEKERKQSDADAEQSK